MTIIDTTPTQAADLTPVEETVQGPEVRRISPHTLVVEDNIRSQVDLDRAFVNSIKLHGVIVPILAHPDQDGNIIVRDGQRRTLAARECPRQADDDLDGRLVMDDPGQGDDVGILHVRQVAGRARQGGNRRRQ